MAGLGLGLYRTNMASKYIKAMPMFGKKQMLAQATKLKKMPFKSFGKLIPGALAAGAITGLGGHFIGSLINPKNKKQK